MQKTLTIDNYLAGWGEATYKGSQGTFDSSIAIDPDHSISESGIKTSAMLVPVVYEKFSSSLVTGNVKWMITNPKNNLIYAYSDNPTGTSTEFNSSSLLASPNLKAYYRTTSGAVTTDSSGAAKTLTNNNSVTTAAGKFGDAADFGTANTNKSLSIADALSYTGAAYSVVMWAKITTELTTDGDGYILAQVNDSASDSILQVVYEQILSTKYISFRRIAHGSSAKQTSYAITMGTSTFHHIVGTYDGGNLKVYVDSIVSSTVAASGSGTTAVTDKTSIGAP